LEEMVFVVAPLSVVTTWIVVGMHTVDATFMVVTMVDGVVDVVDEVEVEDVDLAMAELADAALIDDCAPTTAVENTDAP